MRLEPRIPSVPVVRSRSIAASRSRIRFSTAGSSGSASGSPPFTPFRTPRQCIGPAPRIPRRLCVTMGPFIGWKSGIGPCRAGMATRRTGLFSIVPAGSPRSHAMSSMSANRWQLAHAESPSKIQTSPRPTDGLVSSRSPGRSCPRCASATTTFSRRAPATTMSRGSSPTSNVSRTNGRDASVASITETLSDR